MTATGREDDEGLTLETSFGGQVILVSSSNYDDDSNKNPTNLHIWQWKIVFCTLCTCISHLLTFWRRSRSFHHVKWSVSPVCVWTTRAYDNKCSILSSYLDCRIVRTDFASVTTLNNWEMIVETRSSIFRWRSRCRLCWSSLLSALLTMPNFHCFFNDAVPHFL